MDKQDRLHAVDAVRAFALLLGIAGHAAVSFMADVQAAGSPIADKSTSEPLAISFYVIHIFRMPLFFMIAGFFARMSLQRRGLRQFIKERSKRVLLPLLVGWPACMIAFVPIFIWAMYVHNGGKMPTAAPSGASFFSLAHLWFLYYLLWMYAIGVAAHAVFAALDKQEALRRVIDRVVKFLVKSNLAPVACAVPVAAALYGIDNWLVWGGIPAPERTLVPQVLPLLCFVVAFGFGWVLQRQSDLLQTWERWWPVNLIAAIALTWLSMHLIRSYGGLASVPNGALKAEYAFTYSLAMWTSGLAVLGFGLRFFAKEGPVMRYVADSSYWIYIVHLPVVFALQTAVMNVDLHWTIKFTFIVVATFAITLLMYHYWVRPTAIGVVLNGRRYPRSKAARVLEVEGSPAAGGG